MLLRRRFNSLTWAIVHVRGRGGQLSSRQFHTLLYTRCAFAGMRRLVISTILHMLDASNWAYLMAREMFSITRLSESRVRWFDTSFILCVLFAAQACFVSCNIVRNHIIVRVTAPVAVLVCNNVKLGFIRVSLWFHTMRLNLGPSSLLQYCPQLNTGIGKPQQLPYGAASTPLHLAFVRFVRGAISLVSYLWFHTYVSYLVFIPWPSGTLGRPRISDGYAPQVFPLQKFGALKCCICLLVCLFILSTNMPQIGPKHFQHRSKTCPKHFQRRLRTCPNLAQHMSSAGPRHDQHTHVQNISKIYLYTYIYIYIKW